MTPLIDVLLVLIIIFIITIPSHTHSIYIDNPIATRAVAKLRVIDVLIDFDGSIFWNGRHVDREVIQTHIRHEAAENPQAEIHLSVDRFAKYEFVAQTLADLQRQGLQRIGFVNNNNL